jgi:hypothetical protein
MELLSMMGLRRLRLIEQQVRKLFILLRKDIASLDRLADPTGFAILHLQLLAQQQRLLSTTTALTLTLCHHYYSRIHTVTLYRVFAALVLYIHKNADFRIVSQSLHIMSISELPDVNSFFLYSGRDASKYTHVRVGFFDCKLLIRAATDNSFLLSYIDKISSKENRS